VGTQRLEEAAAVTAVGTAAAQERKVESQVRACVGTSASETVVERM